MDKNIFSIPATCFKKQAAERNHRSSQAYYLRNQYNDEYASLLSRPNVNKILILVIIRYVIKFLHDSHKVIQLKKKKKKRNRKLIVHTLSVSKRITSLVLSMASGIVPNGVVKFLTYNSKKSISQPRNSAVTLVFSYRWNFAGLPATTILLLICISFIGYSYMYQINCFRRNVRFKNWTKPIYNNEERWYIWNKNVSYLRCR